MEAARSPCPALARVFWPLMAVPFLPQHPHRMLPVAVALQHWGTFSYQPPQPRMFPPLDLALHCPALSRRQIVQLLAIAQARLAQVITDVRVWHTVAEQASHAVLTPVLASKLLPIHTINSISQEGAYFLAVLEYRQGAPWSAAPFAFLYVQDQIRIPPTLPHFQARRISKTIKRLDATGFQLAIGHFNIHS